jgi:glycosyl-4,4'-diaponeurosporenoate acyltransferase
MALSGALLPWLASAGLWLGLSLLVGALANAIPLLWLLPAAAPPGEPSAPPPRPAANPLQMRRWKRCIPDAGGALPGGIGKASLARRDPQALQRLIAETRRAELVHWALWPVWLLTVLWLPPMGVLINLAFATLFNLPCLLLQRLNRRRLRWLLWRLRAGLSAPASHP